MLTLARGRLRSQTGAVRQALSRGWQLLGTEPGRFIDPAALADADIGVLPWLDAPALGPVAEVLKQAGQWSLDAPPRRFDAQDWWYRLRFDLADDLDAAKGVRLELDGLATIADVWLNGEAILHSENMFMAHGLDVGARLKPAGNELVLAFRSLDQALTRRRPRPRWRAPMIENQQLRWFRTTVLGRTPGWSPPAAVVGPWRGMSLVAAPVVELTDPRLHATAHGASGLLAVQCMLATQAGALVESARLVVSRGGVVHEQLLQPQEGGAHAAELALPDVASWWPHTHGEPALYDVALQVRVRDAAGVVHDVAMDLGATGFRRIELDRTDEGFALKVNGEPVFCRGSCWTPLDIVTLDAASPQAYADAIRQVRDAGMNMIRVGGTMAYEADAFYDECDRQGVLVWQEFMFANMDYPEDPAFTAGARAEAHQQLARWQARPSLAVLCGNSEVEQQAAMFGATRDRWAPALFHDTLAQAASTLCPDVPYWPSSAHGGAFPHQNDVGTTSYYGVGAYQRGLDDARRASLRFATECLAFANVPEQPALAAMPGGLSLRMHHPAWKTRAPRDLGAGWDFEDVRDHYVAQLFKVDPARLRYSDHERYLALSRVAVGEVMAASFAEWRRAGSVCDGALIWFLRDLWPGAGWGVVDSLGQPKAPYHFLRRALQPVAVSMTDEGGNGVYLHVVNETDRPIQAQLRFTALRQGQTQVAQAQRDWLLPARACLSEPLAASFDWFADWSWAYRFGPPSAQVLVATLLSASGEMLSQAFAFPVGHDLPLERDLGLRIDAAAQGDGHYLLTLQTERFAQAVHIEADGLLADDNHFHLAPGMPRTVVLRPSGGRPPDALSATVRALNSDQVLSARA